MIEKLIQRMASATTAKELLAYKTQVTELYNEVFAKLSDEIHNITNYEDIKSLHDLESPMMAYYGLDFYEKCGIPFLKEHHPETIDIIEFVILFYTIQIFDLLENGFWNETSLCIYDKERHADCFSRVEKMNFTESSLYKQNLFISLWFYFMRVITLEDNEREFPFDHESCTDVFYIDDDYYEYALDIIYENYDGSQYARIINKILGIYRMRFTKMLYLLEYQPLFVSVGFKYLCTII